MEADKLIPRKAELVEELKKARQEMGQGQTQTAEKALPSMGGPLSEDKILSQQPVSVQTAYQNLPKTAQKAILKKGSM